MTSANCVFPYAGVGRYYDPVERHQRTVRFTDSGWRQGGRELAVSFPLFCEWIRELQPGTSPEDAIQRVVDKLKPIIVRRLPDADQFQECQNDVLMLLEKKLGEPMEFSVKVFRMVPESPVTEPHSARIMHLLRADPFMIVARHQELAPIRKYSARLLDVGESRELAAASGLACLHHGIVSIRFPYEALQHEQVAMLNLLSEAESPFVYYYCVKAVRHESFDVRMGFVVGTARLSAKNRAWKESEARNKEVLMDDMSAIPATEGASVVHTADLLARKAVSGLSPKMRDQLHLHYVRGVPWGAIADRYNMKEDVLRKHASRALNEIAESIVAAHAGATKGAAERVVRWLYEMLPRIWQRS
jgi:hypothetical protein